jgi:Domain of unknown function DUF29.
MTTIQSTTTAITSLYDQDFYLWLQTTINILKEGKFAEVDLENILEELEKYGEKREKCLNQ